MITQEMLEDIFAPGGLLDNSLAGYEKRDDQLAMAETIAKCFNDGGKAVIEAGTGIGKSYAYLAVALLDARENPGERTVVATSNVALQQQLIQKDLPTLVDAIASDAKYALLLGRSRYVCLRRALDLDAGQAFASWLASTETGIADEAPKGARRAASSVRSSRETCLGRRCPKFSKCFHRRAHAAAAAADIIVTNHAMLFTDSMFRGGEADYTEDFVLPAYSRLVVDECHNIDRAATDHFSRRLDGAAVDELRGTLFLRKAEGEGATLAQLLAPNGEGLREADLWSLKSTSEAKIFLESLVTAEDRRRDKSEMRASEAIVPFSAHAGEAESLREALWEVAKWVRERLRAAGSPSWAAYAESVAEAHESAMELIGDFLRPEARPETVFHYQYPKGDVALVASPLSVAGTLRDNLFSKIPVVVCCSATIKAGRDFSYFTGQVGLEGEDILTGFHPSPFDYASNAMLLYPAREDGMEFKNTQREAYSDYLAKAITELVEVSEGAAMVLFTSSAMLDSVLSKVRERTERTIYAQTGGASPDALRRAFLSDRGSVLFGLKSFWEGIDAPGDALRMLIVTQLPFPHINDCVKKSRGEKLEAEGSSGFAHIVVPEMLISLKQGLGRLIRSEEDRGVAVILDARARRYMNLIRECLPPYYIPDEEGLTVESFPSRAENFLFN